MLAVQLLRHFARNFPERGFQRLVKARGGRRGQQGPHQLLPPAQAPLQQPGRTLQLLRLQREQGAQEARQLVGEVRVELRHHHVVVQLVLRHPRPEHVVVRERAGAGHDRAHRADLLERAGEDAQQPDAVVRVVHALVLHLVPAQGARRDDAVVEQAPCGGGLVDHDDGALRVRLGQVAVGSQRVPDRVVQRVQPVPVAVVAAAAQAFDGLLDEDLPRVQLRVEKVGRGHL